MNPCGTPCRLVLASASPRRREILGDAGIRFEAFDPGEVEAGVTNAATPEALAIAKARAKAAVIAPTLRPPFPAVIVGVDTLVASPDGHIAEKPLDRTDAVAMLTRLSGSRHCVISGLCLWPLRGSQAPVLAPKLAAESTWVTMRHMSSEEIAAYVASGEADGKAGAYAVQETGDRFVEKMEGSFLNVVGFPLELFQRLWPLALKEWGF